jgi:predicted enzyme related to lactoylglutathione lyase
VLAIGRSNSILYCSAWAEVVEFYGQRLGLPVSFANDWFVEFELGAAGFVSVADAARASIVAGDGRGITLSWQVPDVTAARAELVERGVDVSAIGRRFEADVIDTHDPAGNRIELWSA